MSLNGQSFVCLLQTHTKPMTLCVSYCGAEIQELFIRIRDENKTSSAGLFFRTP